MKSRLHFIAAIGCAVFLAACGGVSNDDDKVTLDPTTQPAAFSYTDTSAGTGTDVVAAGDAITVNYKLWLYKSDATNFEGTSIENSTTPFPFTVGNGTVIAGFDQGVLGMKVGTVRRLILPSSVAYGSQIKYKADGTVLIPAYSGLLYELTLVTLKKKGT